MLAVKSRDAFGNDVPQESFGAETVMFEDVVRRTFVAFRIKNRTGEIDLQEVDLAVFIHPEIEAGITFTLETNEDIACSAPQFFAERGISNRHVRFRRVCFDLEVVCFEAFTIRKDELERSER